MGKDKTDATQAACPEVFMAENVLDPTSTEVAAAASPERLTLWQCIKKYRYASLLCVCAAVGTLSDGYQVQMSGSIIALNGFMRTFGALQPNGKYVLDAQHVALWGSLKNVAAMFGAAVGSWPADVLGRRWMILSVQIVMVGAAILEQFATTWTMWLGARLLAGFSIGLAQCCISVYISEMAPTAGRGALLSLTQLSYVIGAFFSTLALNIVTQDKPENWRRAVLSQFVLTGVATIAWLFLPESPRWHCMHGREHEAKKILSKVYKGVEDYDIDAEYRKMLVELENTQEKQSAQKGGSYLEVFQGTNLRRLFISFLPWHWQIALGIPIIGTYSSYFYQKAGLQNPFLGTIATNIVSILSLFAAVPLVERFGRRTLLLACSPLALIALLVIGGVLRTDTPAVGSVLVVFAVLWAIGQALSATVMGYIYVAEIPTTRLRAKSTGVAIFFIQGMATVYVYITPIMLNAPSMGMSNTVFFFFGTGTFIYILVAYFVPETKGRTFAELDELFERRIPAWRFSKTETHVSNVPRGDSSAKLTE